MNSLQKMLSRFKEIFFIETTALFVLRKSFLFSMKPSPTHLLTRVRVYVETNLHCIAARFALIPYIYYVCLFRLVLCVK